VDEGRVVVLAYDVAGLRHGARTLTQLIQRYGTRYGDGLLLPKLRVEDWPELGISPLLTPLLTLF